VIHIEHPPGHWSLQFHNVVRCCTCARAHTHTHTHTHTQFSQVNQINQPFWGQNGYQRDLGWQNPWSHHYSELIAKDTYWSKQWLFLQIYLIQSSTGSTSNQRGNRATPIWGKNTLRSSYPPASKLSIGGKLFMNTILARILHGLLCDMQFAFSPQLGTKQYLCIWLTHWNSWQEQYS